MKHVTPSLTDAYKTVTRLKMWDASNVYILLAGLFDDIHSETVNRLGTVRPNIGAVTKCV
jgi:hypothetical protein